MMENMIEKIEVKLEELMNLSDEKEYTTFIENDKFLKIYDLVMDLEDNNNVLTNEFLKKIYSLVEAKVNSSK